MTGQSVKFAIYRKSFYISNRIESVPKLVDVTTNMALRFLKYLTCFLIAAVMTGCEQLAGPSDPFAGSNGIGNAWAPLFIGTGYKF